MVASGRLPAQIDFSHTQLFLWSAGTAANSLKLRTITLKCTTDIQLILRSTADGYFNCTKSTFNPDFK